MEAIKARVIDVKITWVSNYRCPIWRSSNRTPVIGYPRDRAPITWQIGAWRTNHDREFCYRYDYNNNNFISIAVYTKALYVDVLHVLNHPLSISSTVRFHNRFLALLWIWWLPENSGHLYGLCRISRATPESIFPEGRRGRIRRFIASRRCWVESPLQIRFPRLSPLPLSHTTRKAVADFLLSAS